jgi:hypothetical protein
MQRKIIVFAAFLYALLSIACFGHKQQFHTIVINESGVPLHSIEVEYPGGTYGIEALPAGASNHKWVFVSGNCRYELRFVDASGKQYSPKPLEIARGACPLGITLTINSAMNVTAAATPQ